MAVERTASKINPDFLPSEIKSNLFLLNLGKHLSIQLLHAICVARVLDFGVERWDIPLSWFPTGFGWDPSDSSWRTHLSPPDAFDFKWVRNPKARRGQSSPDSAESNQSHINHLQSMPTLAPKLGTDFPVWSWSLPEGRRTTRMCGMHLAFVPNFAVSEAYLIWDCL